MEQGIGAPVHSSLAFDLTVTGLLAPLAAGKAVHFLPDEADVSALADIFKENNHFSLIKITPPHLDLLSQMTKAQW